MSDNDEIVNMVLEKFTDILEVFDFKIHQNILPMNMNCEKLYECAPGYKIELYTWNYAINVYITHIESGEVLNDCYIPVELYRLKRYIKIKDDV